MTKFVKLKLPVGAKKIDLPAKFKKHLHIDYSKYRKDQNGKIVDAEGNPPPVEEVKDASLYDANLYGSKIFEGMHKVVLDLDMPVQLVPSSTEGHYHLIIEKILAEEQMDKLINVLVEVGIINEGIKTMQWDIYREVFIRPPWVKKGFDLTWAQQFEEGIIDSEGNEIPGALEAYRRKMHEKFLEEQKENPMQSVNEVSFDDPF